MTTIESINALYTGAKTKGLPIRNLSAVRRRTGQILDDRSIIIAGTARFFVNWGGGDRSRRRIAALNKDAVDLARILLGCEMELVDGSGVCTKAEYFEATGTVAQAVRAAQSQPVASKKAAM